MLLISNWLHLQTLNIQQFQFSQDVDIEKIVFQSAKHFLDPCLRAIVGPTDSRLAKRIVNLAESSHLDILEVHIVFEMTFVSAVICVFMQYDVHVMELCPYYVPQLESFTNLIVYRLWNHRDSSSKSCYQFVFEMLLAEKLAVSSHLDILEVHIVFEMALLSSVICIFMQCNNIV